MEIKEFGQNTDRRIVQSVKLESEVIIMRYAVVSYWVGETGDTELWLYDTEKEAIEALNRLWEQSYNLALEDEDFDKDNSYHEDYFAVVAWKDELYRYFEVVKQNEKEVIR